MIRVFIVEDHPVMRQSLRTLLSRQDDLNVCGEAHNGEDAIRQIADTRPDLVLIDVSLPGMNGIQLVRALHEDNPALPMAILSGHGGEAHVQQALNAGARGYILKGNAAELPAAIRILASGEQYLSQTLNKPG